MSSGDEEAERRSQRGLKGFNLSDDEPTLINLHFNERPLRGSGPPKRRLAETGAKMADSWLRLFSRTAGEALPAMWLLFSVLSENGSGLLRRVPFPPDVSMQQLCGGCAYLMRPLPRCRFSPSRIWDERTSLLLAHHSRVEVSSRLPPFRNRAPECAFWKC